MRGLTLTQPFATLVAMGAKRIETRCWPTSYRGPLLIHAARGWDDPLGDVEWAGKHLVSWGHDPGPFAHGFQLPRGKVVARCRLADCLPTEPRGPAFPRPGSLEWTFGDYSEGRWMWLLEDVEAIDPPVPFKGSLGLWRIPPELATVLGTPGVQLTLF